MRYALFLTLGIALLLGPSEATDAQPRGGSLRHPDRLKVGDVAPDFTLKTKDGRQSVTLSSYRGDKPVALVFGSYT